VLGLIGWHTKTRCNENRKGNKYQRRVAKKNGGHFYFLFQQLCGKGPLLIDKHSARNATLKREHARRCCCCAPCRKKAPQKLEAESLLARAQGLSAVIPRHLSKQSVISLLTSSLQETIKRLFKKRKKE
jgi:hypothetical protein